jgi:type I restriction enzyme S subunit
MSNRWRECTLGDVLEVKHGYAFRGEFFADAGTHVVLTPGNFYDTGGFKEDLGKRKWYNGPIPPEYVLKEGDLIVAMTEQGEGLLGSSALVPQGGIYLHNQRLGLVQMRDGSLADSQFLYFLFNSRLVRQQIRASASGTKVRHTSPARIADVRVLLPSVDVQRRIGNALRAYDDLIENSLRRIQIVDEMARALYREWFVRFRFPGHERLPRVPSILGGIPQGWTVRKLGEILTLDKGVSYNGAGLTDDGNPMVNLKNIRPGGGFRRDATKPYSGKFKARHTVRQGDVIVANTDLTQAGNVVGSPALVPQLTDGKPILISHHLFAVRPAAEISPLFLYYLMLSEDFRGFAKGFAIGTTVLGLPKEGILTYAFGCPPLSLIRDFVARVSPIHELIEVLHKRIENLRRTRDLLLPRLLSGQIELSPN